jgi:tetratricopeptide (TPR) repeat protein
MSGPKSSGYIQRVVEQDQIIAEVEKVREARESRAVFLYGDGGMGKTRLLRHLPDVIQDPRIRCLDPIDVDDSQHWLLSNLEQYVADNLDPERQSFVSFRKYVRELPERRFMPTSRDAILSHLNQIKTVFVQDYQEFISENDLTVIVTFDTTEAIRGMYLLRVFTEWIRSLPRTLFILAGRSPDGATDWRDPIQAALKEPPLDMHTATVRLGEFNPEDCLRYLAPISEEGRLTAEQIEKLVHLTQGHPLWLALTVDYLAVKGIPEEARDSLEVIKSELPYHGDATPEGSARAEAFKSRLVTPYRDADFRHEAIKRLAIVRESVSQPIWQELMADRARSANVDFDQAWRELCKTEWIRPRANSRYVTLHDAVAEELARRVINLNDFDGRERLKQWGRAAAIYDRQASEIERELAEKVPEVDARLQARDKTTDAAAPPARDDAALIQEVTELDNRRQELNQLKVARLFYQLLSDRHEGVRQFVEMLSRAGQNHDVLLEDLLAFQMQRFLPGRADESILDDTVGATIRQFRAWLGTVELDSYVDVGLEVANYLIRREQLEAAYTLLGQLPVPQDRKRRYRLRNLQGNACLRIPGRVRESDQRFHEALAEASQFPGADRDRYSAEAHKELGFYYRNIGRWLQADQSYQKAYEAISRVLGPRETKRDREQLASIYTNWAYVKGIGGHYEDGVSLVLSAIGLRRRLGLLHEQAQSCSVKGEVYRYQRQFKEAWDAYAEAEQLFREQNSWSWLGVIYQEQAICLFQSIPARVQLLDPPLGANPGLEAEKLILHALELCRDLNVRSYPSALNRAGRIFGARDRDGGLAYLLEAAEKAQDLYDGWFWMASLIEYAELSYGGWSATRDPAYLAKIHDIEDKVRQSQAADLEFPELRGRWKILKGHLAMRAAIDTESADALHEALDYYQDGFRQITHGAVGSYGVSAVPREFEKAKELARELPPKELLRWRRGLHTSWGNSAESTTQLLPLLEDLY